MSSLDQLHHDYGNAYLAFQLKIDPALPLPNLSASYLTFRLGVSGTHLAASILSEKKMLAFYLLLEGKHRDKMFSHLYVHKAIIDAGLQGTPVWNVSRSSNRAWVTVELNVADFEDRSDWPQQHTWIFKQRELFDEAFRKRLRDLKGAP